MNEKLNHLLQKPEFPKSNRYEQTWMIENQMGPNAVWLAEWLSESIPFKPGMRVLELGCGRAMSSIFLAREFDVQVWAADLWITPDNNWSRILEAGVDGLVFPLRAEAHALPFAAGFFDAIISIDAYQYFGTDILYLGYLSRFLATDGYLGVVMPGLTNSFDEVPEHLSKPQSNGKVFWEEECWSFKTADWWNDLWKRSSAVRDIQVDLLADGWRHWHDFEKAVGMSGKGHFPSDAEALASDGGRYIGFVRAVARRAQSDAINLYDPSVGAQAGVDN